jgi:hypothetical protein
METNNLLNTLHDIRDRCFVYSIMLAESASSLGKMKIFFKMPAIFISIVLSVINSSKLNETEEINIINTVFNAFIALLIGVENTLQIDNKKQVFTSTKNKFEKLLSTIEKRLLDTSEPIHVEFVQNTINEFEQIDDDLTFDIPKSVQERAKKNFTSIRTLPLILGGEKVAHQMELQTYLNLEQQPQQLQTNSKISQNLQQQQSQQQQSQQQQLQSVLPHVLQVQPLQPLQTSKPVQIQKPLETLKEQDDHFDVDEIINTVL